MGTSFWKSAFVPDVLGTLKQIFDELTSGAFDAREHRSMIEASAPNVLHQQRCCIERHAPSDENRFVRRRVVNGNTLMTYRLAVCPSRYSSSKTSSIQVTALPLSASATAKCVIASVSLAPGK